MSPRTPASSNRWGQVYSLDDVQSEIRRLLDTNQIANGFWSPGPQKLPPAQGDVIRLDAALPVMSAANPSIHFPGDQYEYWMVLSNSCDLARDREDVPWMHVVPVVCLGTVSELKAEELSSVKSYMAYRQFYLPPWAKAVEESVYVADFIQNASLERRPMFEGIEICASVHLYSWFLLNACLVRYLARDDGRED